MEYRVYDEFSDYEQLTDGSVRAKLTMPMGNWVYHYLATFGEHYEILEPGGRSLRDAEETAKTLSQ